MKIKERGSGGIPHIYFSPAPAHRRLRCPSGERKPSAPEMPKRRASKASPFEMPSGERPYAERERLACPAASDAMSDSDLACPAASVQLYI